MQEHTFNKKQNVLYLQQGNAGLYIRIWVTRNPDQDKAKVNY